MGYEILYRECIDTSTFEQLVISLFWILFQNSVHLESFLNPFLIALQIFLTFALKTLFNTNSYTTCTLSENMPEGLSVTKSIQFYLENGNSKRVFRQFERNWTVMAVRLKFRGKSTESVMKSGGSFGMKMRNAGPLKRPLLSKVVHFELWAFRKMYEK